MTDSGPRSDAGPFSCPEPAGLAKKLALHICKAMPKFMPSAAAVLLSALLLVGPAAPALADVKISTRNTYYDIRGRTAQDIWRQLQLYSIRHVGLEGHVLAQCRYSFKPDGRAVRTDRGWLPASVEVTLDITYSYPRWVSANYATPEIRAMWAKVIDLFERHEEGHAVIALRNANLMVQRIRAIPPQPTQQALRAQVKALLDAIVERDNREQITFDEHCTDNAQLRGYFQAAGADTNRLD